MNTAPQAPGSLKSSRVALPATFRLTRTKRDTLALLAEYFCLRTNDAAAILRSRIPTESDKRTLRHTLGSLYKAGLAYRLPYLDLDRERGPVNYVYGLSDKGVKYCVEFYDGRCKTFDDHSQRTLDHELEISMFHSVLNGLCMRKHFPLYWQQDDLKCTVNPDAMFAITNPALPDGRNTFYYFLEIERAKMGNYKDGGSSIMRKLAKYYEYYNSTSCKKEWGNFQHFRVVVVQRTEDRRNNLLQELHMRFNHRMFWLTTEALYKEDIGASIFKTPKDLNARGYSFLDI
ncbi:MAG: replication-relaxation family protein [Terriglobia bacterium]|nr:replication-relaxation family protein [Terriglobia bacterium]